MGQTGVSVVVSEADAVQIREALRDILESAQFRSSHQCQALLTYVVDHTLAGESDLLRERVIGNVVFGRQADYVPSDDPIVRVRALDVRKRLAQYYQGQTNSLVRIGIPPGSYRAVFGTQTSPLPEGDKPSRRRPRWVWAALVLLAAMAGSAIVIRGLSTPSPSALERFWAPALASPKPILIYNATMTVLRPADAPGSADLVTVRGQYTCIGDAYASVVLSSLLSRLGKLYHMRYGDDLTFGDLRFQPSILIGAFNNTWTL